MTSLLPALPRTYPHLKEKRVFNKLHPIYYTGLPVDQYYDLTLLKRSNIRSNDQLLPRPGEVDMTKIQIDKTFPAEHPYSSHMSRFALFPSFANSPDDYKTGEAAKESSTTLHPQMPASSYDVTINHKTKGAGDRWETQDLPLDSQKRPLSWPGDVFFQNRKTPTSGQQNFYPIPPKAVLPSHAPRSLDFSIHPRTANALRNVERSQWVTTYNKNFTGYGPANALRLDNYDEKVDMEKRTAIENHSLRPRSYPTFMPPRPLEGRISRLIGPNQCVRCVIKDGRIEYVPFSPKVDIEMDKVPEYRNLPTETQQSFQDPTLTDQWKKLQAAQHPELQLRKLEEMKQQSKQEPENSLSGFSEETKKKEEGGYLKQMAERRKEELEALTQNTRWKQAEQQEHHHDLRLLKRKVDYTTPQLQSPVYYDTLHKIYSTKPPFYYDGDNPYEYDFVGPWDYHKTETLTDAYKLEAARGELAKSRAGRSVKDGGAVMDVQFAGSPGKNPYITPKYTQQQLLHGRPRLEASIAQKPVAQSTYTYSFNPDFVKTVITPDNSRFDLRDMSKSLPNMYSSRPSSKSTGSASKSVHFNDTAQVATGGGESPLVTKDYKPSERLGGTSMSWNYPAFENPGSSPKVDGRHFNPEGTRDPRLDWKPSSPFGPRPQTKLSKIQDSFTKTDARKEFHGTFPETNPDLRENIYSGKKHDFEGLNACNWH
ncbi:uncharacterized protein LOC110984527 isoform X2 [Acanthaster planci]|uniref:Uncharacterized protein LOC110984527 isoform X2 n=1 Tax=Acanthaster planci TaxID=133434 RepID=A0A8B7Z6C3_ACAPL|nr:uncharacterized protein LOC110984527 isoform X2 [Acanthaster planci]